MNISFDVQFKYEFRLVWIVCSLSVWAQAQSFASYSPTTATGGSIRPDHQFIIRPISLPRKKETNFQVDTEQLV